ERKDLEPRFGRDEGLDRRLTGLQQLRLEVGRLGGECRGELVHFLTHDFVPGLARILIREPAPVAVPAGELLAEVGLLFERRGERRGGRGQLALILPELRQGGPEVRFRNPPTSRTQANQ